MLKLTKDLGREIADLFSRAVEIRLLIHKESLYYVPHFPILLFSFHELNVQQTLKSSDNLLLEQQQLA